MFSLDKLCPVKLVSLTKTLSASACWMTILYNLPLPAAKGTRAGENTRMSKLSVVKHFSPLFFFFQKWDCLQNRPCFHWNCFYFSCLFVCGGKIGDQSMAI